MSTDYKAVAWWGRFILGASAGHIEEVQEAAWKAHAPIDSLYFDKFVTQRWVTLRDVTNPTTLQQIEAARARGEL